MVTVSMTVPWVQVMSSCEVGGPQIASTRMPVALTSMRMCARCMARKAVRASLADHGGSSGDPPPPVVMCTTCWMGRKRS